MITVKWFTDKLGEDCFFIRKAVFVEEQKIPAEIELDGYDNFSKHVVIYEKGAPVACGRLSYKEGDYYIGRVAVLKEKRKKRYGVLVMNLLVDKAFVLGAEKVVIHAQQSVRDFYLKLGFKAQGGLFEEAGIPHVRMEANGKIDKL